MDGKMHGWMDVLVGSMAKWKDPNDDDVLTPGILSWRSLSVGGLFFSFAATVRSVSGFTLVPLVKISFSNHKNQLEMCGRLPPPILPAGHQTHLQNCAAKLRPRRTAGFPSGCGQLLPFDLPSPGRHWGNGGND